MNLRQENINEQPIIIVLIGDTAVGKTCIVNKLHHGTFDSHEPSTIANSFFTYTTMIDDKPIKLQIWDTAGEEKYRSIGPYYYKRASAAAIIYDVTSEKTFRNLNFWINEFSNASNIRENIFIVGNKIDLVEQAVVSYEEGKKFADDQEFYFFQTSAKSGEGISELFNSIARACSETIGHVASEFIDIEKIEPPQNSKYCCYF